MTFHRTQVIGNLGNDPELRYSQSGTARTTFRVAVNDRWTGGDGQVKEHTKWYELSRAMRHAQEQRTGWAVARHGAQPCYTVGRRAYRGHLPDACLRRG